MKRFAELQADADVFRFDGSDLMPGAVGSGTFWTEVTAWVTGGSTDDFAEQRRGQLARQLTRQRRSRLGSAGGDEACASSLVERSGWRGPAPARPSRPSEMDERVSGEIQWSR